MHRRMWAVFYFCAMLPVKSVAIPHAVVMGPGLTLINSRQAYQLNVVFGCALVIT